MKPLSWLVLTLAMSLFAIPTLAHERHECHDRGERIEHRLDRRGARIERRFDWRAEHQRALGHPRRAAALERRGEGIDRRLHRIGARIDARHHRCH